MKVKEENEKAGLKLNIQKTKIMASGPITLQQVDGEIVRDFIFGGSKITADGDCSHENKRCLLLGRKNTPNLDNALKSRDITLSIKFYTSHVRLFVTPQTVACQAPLSMESVMLDSILKSRDITLPTKFCLVKAMVFPVVMYECESWTIKKAECWRIDTLELWC